MAFILKNVALEIQSALSSPAAVITDISNATEAVITATHDFSVGDIVVVNNVVGMPDINRVVSRVKSVSTTVSFVLEKINTTNFPEYVSGGTVQKVTTFLPFNNVSGFSMPDEPPAKENATTIHDSRVQELTGMQGALSATINIFQEFVDAPHMVECELAQEDQLPRVFRMTVPNQGVVLINAEVSGGLGIDGQAGGIATGVITLVPLRKRLVLPIAV